MEIEKQMSSRLAILSIVLIVIVGLYGNRNYIVVQTPQCGKIRGLKVHLDSKQIYEFYNIPYAVPPVGELRFKPTRELENGNCYHSSGVLDATNNMEHIMCIQSTTGNGTEDCLVLTIRSPDIAATKPVVFWIHGGGLVNGNNDEPGYYFDTELTASLDVVTVSINYRLGYLGFAAFEEVWDPVDGNFGNNGIRDQITALKWVQKNIRSFGGDPNSVTIIGESGGGTAVLALLSSPLANNLFHNAISLSPAPEFRFDYVTGDMFQRDVLVPLGCTHHTLEERRQCLMDLPANKFSNLALKGLGLGRPWDELGYFNFPMRHGKANEAIGMVTVDPTVITVSPKDLKHAKFVPSSNVKVVISNTAQETAMLSEISAKYIPGLVNQIVFSNYEALNATLGPLFSKLSQKKDILEEVYKMYPNLSPQLLWDTLVTDMRFTCPTNTVAYEISQTPNREVYRIYITNSMQNEPKYSSLHGWDTWALFGFKEMLGRKYIPGHRDLRFRESLKDVIRKLTFGNDVFRDWKKYPDNSLVLGNTESGYEIITHHPDDNQCVILDGLGFSKYGSQN